MTDMINVVNKQVNLAILALLTGFALTAHTALVSGVITFYEPPSKHYPAAWRAGYSQGFLGINLGGKGHTQAFFYGYLNGSKDFWWDKGYAYGISGKHGGLPKGYYGEDLRNSPEKQFHWGNESGAKDRVDMQNAYDDNYGPGLYQLSPMPANTTDNHMSYYVGFENGKRANDNQTKAITTTYEGYYDSGCQSGDPAEGKYVNGHYEGGKWIEGRTVVTEYCAGFKAGWNSEKISNDED
jgi:hypothetical protein